MKSLQVPCIVIAVMVSLAAGVKLGKFTCTGLDPDMEHTLTFKCPMDITAVNANDLGNIQNEADAMKVLEPAMCPHFKCVFGILKAIDDKGKVISAKAEKYSECFPKGVAPNAKAKVAACVKSNNAQLKKETGNHVKSWKGMCKCMLEVLNMDPCPGGS